MEHMDCRLDTETKEKAGRETGAQCAARGRPRTWSDTLSTMPSCHTLCNDSHVCRDCADSDIDIAPCKEKTTAAAAVEANNAAAPRQLRLSPGLSNRPTAWWAGPLTELQLPTRHRIQLQLKPTYLTFRFG